MGSRVQAGITTLQEKRVKVRVSCRMDVHDFCIFRAGSHSSRDVVGSKML